MKNIIVGNSTSRIVGLTPPILKYLRFNVCYFDFALYRRQGKFKNPDKCRTFLIDEDGMFLTGLGPHVFKFLKDKYPDMELNFIDNRIKPRSFHKYVELFEDHSPYFDQRAAIDACLESHGRGVVCLPTGVGKSLCIKILIKELGMKTLVVPPSLNLKTQICDYMIESFGEDEVMFYKKGKPSKNITVMNYHAIKGEKPEFFKDFDCIIYDEFHHAANNSIRENEKTHLSNIFYRFAFTATNFRNNDDNILLESVMSEQLYDMSLKEAINKKYITPVKAIFIDLKNSIKPRVASKGKGNPSQYQLDYSDFIVESEERNNKALEIAERMQSLGVPTLILVKQVEHGLFFADRLKDSRFANSTTQKPEQNLVLVKEFNAGKIPILIGTSVLGEGVDTKRCGAIINVGGGQAESELLQKVGRVVRIFKGKLIGFYFDFIDNNSKSLKKHSNTRKKIIAERFGLKVQIIKNK